MDTQAPIALERRLLKEQMDILAGNLPGITAGTAFLAPGASLMLALSGWPQDRVLGWLAGLLAFLAARLGAFRWFRRRGITVENAHRWATAAVVSSALAGMAWGTLGLLFFDPDEPLTVAILAIVLSAMMASATNSLGAYWRANLAFSLPCIVPLTVHFLLEPSLQMRILGVLGLVYLGFTTSYARGIARAIRDSLLLRFENQELLEDLRQAKERAEVASQAKTRFLAAASHDLRQPLHAMNLSLPVLRRVASTSSPMAGVVDDVTGRLQVALDSMGKLLHLLLDVSRLDAGALTPQLQACEVGAAMGRAAEQVQAQAAAQGLSIRVVDRGHWVLCDEVMLQSMLSNLVENAVRYTSSGGVLIGTRLRQGQVHIEVWDTGCGVPAQDIPRLCEEFFQAHHPERQHNQARGFGLGLAIVKRMAALTGGELHIRSRVGRGSRFSVSLPACEPPQTPAAPATSVQAQGQQRTVLVVDNDEQILAALRALLEQWGHRVVLAQNVDTALVSAIRHAEQIDVALIDYHLGGQTTGLQVARLLRQLVRQDMPTVILTGDTSRDILYEARESGTRVVYKPVEPGTLQGIIEDIA